MSDKKEILLQNLNKFNLKYERCKRRYSTISILSIRQIIRNIEFVFRSWSHQLQTFYPTINHLVYVKFTWRPSIHRTVKNLTFYSCSVIMNLYLAIF